MSDILDFLSDMFPIMLPAVERSPQSRADRAGAGQSKIAEFD